MCYERVEMAKVENISNKQAKLLSKEILGHAQIKKPCAYAELISLNLSATACDYCPFQLGNCIMQEFAHPSYDIVERLLK